MKNLRELRKKHNLSQQKLADILHISQQSVYKYENDITSPDIETLKNMADYFDTSIDYLVNYTDIPHKIEPVTENMLNLDETILIEQYRGLTIHQKDLVLLLMKEFMNQHHK
ncbi:MAG: helix-turn-helix domain-containing protein [Lachnospiraceae bacterium]|nr:helix-turn-helix domain-containing protein [Lachnospiraceae bacterium]